MFSTCFRTSSAKVALFTATEVVSFRPLSDVKRFASLRASSRLNHEGMNFFDDEMRNIKEVSTFGVTSIHVPDGMITDLFHNTLRAFEDHGQASRHKDNAETLGEGDLVTIRLQIYLTVAS